MDPDVDLNPVLHSGYIGEGPKTKLFEEQIGKLIKNDNVVVLNSGTSAITLALKLAGVEHGDKVVSTPMTCLATNMAVLSVGAKIVWCDILPDGTIDPQDLRKKLTPDIKAVVCMDWGGMPCKYDQILSVLGHIPLIADSCQSLGASYEGKPIGNIARFTAFSFQAIKYLTTGDGGALAISTPHPLLTKALMGEGRMMRWFGLDRNKGADMRCNQDPIAGYKWQMNDIAASIGLANIRSLQNRLQIVMDNAAYYNQRLGYTATSGRQSAYWLYTIFVEDVESFIHYMKEHGVECSRVHDRNDTKSVFREFKTDLPGVDWFDTHHVCIPVGWWVTKEQREHIADTILKHINNGFYGHDD